MTENPEVDCPLRFTLIHPHAGGIAARLGRLRTIHGTVETPTFMPVGTQATVKAMTPADLLTVGAEMILSNTFHLYLRPGHEIIRLLGGIQRFMGWHRPVLTDSGGFQIYSLATLIKVDDRGIRFQSPLDGSEHFMTPELAVEIQQALGSDIAMVLDECLPYPVTESRARESLELTTRWAERSRAAWLRKSPGQGGLFGIVQGGVFADLRRQAAESLVAIGFEGYALGGLSVGEPKESMLQAIEVTVPRLPAEKPRYLMGVGRPEDLLDGVIRGIDLFDCVMPTRHARNGSLFTSRGMLNIKNARWITSDRPPDPDCECTTCRNFSLAYLSHLYRAGEILSSQLNTMHNLHFYLDLMRKIRQAVCRDSLPDFRKEFLQKYHSSS